MRTVNRHAPDARKGFNISAIGDNQGVGLTISESDCRGIPLFALNGEIDIYTVPQFLQAVEEVSRDAPGIAVDLREVSLVDSSGLGALLRLAQIDGSWRPVVLVCEGPSMPRLLELTKLADRFIVVDEVDEVATALEAASRERADGSDGPPTGTPRASKPF